MKKILITGTNGYISTQFTKYIRENFNEDYELTPISLRTGDWKSIDFGRYDTIIHAVGIAHKKENAKSKNEYFKINKDLTINLAEKAKKEGCKQFIFLSSMSVYGMNSGFITKKTKPKPNTNYGQSKLEAENAIKYLQDSKFRVAILRPPMVYGKDCGGNYRKLSEIANKLFVFLDTNNLRSMIYIENLNIVIKQLIDFNSAGTYFPQNDEFVNTSELVKKIRAVRGKKTKIIRVNGNKMNLFMRVSYFRKIFGNLTYEKSLSAQNIDNKEFINFEDSIKLSED
ncbi:UDP-glucose 4-epimerase [Terribacillus halophilus]|uniref:UDP-glucose 4-epimerase n=1 Tax=Terribacillus halophilus TaxID=361279 RepID=A0A1G6IK94_9BACI|nr:NAD-dependent epimerase/dehydratase family protein [Terribacillus halophilus]SDC07002.1 UDP-glucose 4-epimerase [Terribacillus halophilus]